MSNSSRLKWPDTCIKFDSRRSCVVLRSKLARLSPLPSFCHLEPYLSAPAPRRDSATRRFRQVM